MQLFCLLNFGEILWHLHWVYCILFIVYYNILFCRNSFFTFFTIKLIYYNISILNFKCYSLIKCYLTLKNFLLPCFCSVNFGKNCTSFINAMKQNILWQIHALCSNCLLSPVLTSQSAIFGYIDLWIYRFRSWKWIINKSRTTYF